MVQTSMGTAIRRSTRRSASSWTRLPTSRRWERRIRRPLNSPGGWSRSRPRALSTSFFPTTGRRRSRWRSRWPCSIGVNGPIRGRKRRATSPWLGHIMATPWAASASVAFLGSTRCLSRCCSTCFGSTRRIRIGCPGTRRGQAPRRRGRAKVPTSTEARSQSPFWITTSASWSGCSPSITSESRRW